MLPRLPLLPAAEREPQPADEGGQLQLQLLDADKSEPQPLGLESGFQEYLRCDRDREQATLWEG